MIISRDIINKKIKFHDLLFKEGRLLIKSYSFDDLSKLTDGYKNLLLEKGAQTGHKVIIGENLGLKQISCLLACSELGLDICVVQRPDGLDPSVKSNEVELLAPFDYLIVPFFNTKKITMLSAVSNNVIVADEETLDYTPNNTINATAETTFLSCVTNGPKKNVKVVNLNHEFIGNLMKRNSKMFYGNAASLSNLNHGSGPAAYFLPVLVAENVTDYYHLPTSLMREHAIRQSGLAGENKNIPDLSAIFDFLNEHLIKINHLHFPYVGFLDQFLSKNPKAEECVVYILSYIKQEWLQFIENKNIKDIISLYGTSEVSGPVFINQATDVDFSEKSYKKLDDFYGINFTDQNILEVTMPVYNKTVFTSDSFEIINNKYTLLSRKFNPRINDLLIEVDRYHNFLEGKYGSDTSIILDNVKNSLYLAIWDKNMDDLAVQELNKMMNQASNGLHSISKYDFLNKNNFKNAGMNEISNVMLIEYFRNKQ